MSPSAGMIDGFIVGKNDSEESEKKPVDPIANQQQSKP